MSPSPQGLLAHSPVLGFNMLKDFTLTLARRDGDLAKGGHEIVEGTIEVLNASFNQHQFGGSAFQENKARVNAIIGKFNVGLGHGDRPSSAKRMSRHAPRGPSARP
jgi:hypothetical protein